MGGADAADAPGAAGSKGVGLMATLTVVTNPVPGDGSHELAGNSRFLRAGLGRGAHSDGAI